MSMRQGGGKTSRCSSKPGERELDVFVSVSQSFVT